MDASNIAQNPGSGIPASTPPQPPLRRSKLPVVLAILGVVALLAGAAAFAAYKGYIQLPFLAKPPSLTDLTEKIKQIRSARVTTEFAADIVPLEPGVQPLELKKKAPDATDDAASASGLSLVPSSDTMLSGMPGDVSLHFIAKTLVDRNAASPRSDVAVTGKYSAGGMTLDIDAGWKRSDDVNYLQINKLPIPLIDLSPISGLWIKMPASGAGTSILTAMFLGGAANDETAVFGPAASATTAVEVKKAPVTDELGVLLHEAAVAGAFPLKEAGPATTQDGQKIWKLTLGFDADKFWQSYKKTFDARATLLPGFEDYNLLKDDPLSDKNAEARANFDEVMKNTVVEAAIDRQTNDPVYLKLSVPVAVSKDQAPKLEGKEVKFTVSVGFADINSAAAVAAPEGAVDLRQALGKISGKTEADMKLEDQMQIVSDLRSALGAYKDKNGHYPEKLADLVGLEVNPFAGLEMKDADKYLKKVIAIPNDQFKAAAFDYSVADDDFKLKYQLTIPKGTKVLADGYVDGLNTATSMTSSVEGTPVSTSDNFSTFSSSDTVSDDTDNDFLSNEEEKLWGTDPNKADTDGDGLDDWEEVTFKHTDPLKADTDGDGYTDKQEIDGGFDPLTNSKTGVKVTVTPAGQAASESGASDADPDRVTNVKKIQTGLELYYADHNSYPAGTGLVLGRGAAASLCASGFESSACTGTSFLVNVPAASEPPGGACTAEQNDFTYTQTDRGAEYELKFCLGGQVGNLPAGPRVASSTGIK